MKNFIGFFIVLFSFSYSYSQAGPGGVGNTPTVPFWYCASQLNLVDGECSIYG